MPTNLPVVCLYTAIRREGPCSSSTPSLDIEAARRQRATRSRCTVRVPALQLSTRCEPDLSNKNFPYTPYLQTWTQLCPVPNCSCVSSFMSGSLSPEESIAPIEYEVAWPLGPTDTMLSTRIKPALAKKQSPAVRPVTCPIVLSASEWIIKPWKPHVRPNNI